MEGRFVIFFSLKIAISHTRERGGGGGICRGAGQRDLRARRNIAEKFFSMEYKTLSTLSTDVSLYKRGI